MKRVILVILSVGLGSVMAGCHSFIALDPAEVTPGSSVRVTLEREEAVRQVDALGSLSPVIAGLVGDRTDAEVLGLSVRSYGVGAGGLYDTYLEVPWSGVQRVEESRLSWKRTAALAAVGAAIAVGIIQAASGSSGPDDGEGPDEISVPFLRIVWW